MQKLLISLSVTALLISPSTWAERKPICEDLFSAACENADGTSRFKKEKDDLRVQGAEIVKKGRDKAAQAIGADNFDDFLKKSLASQGMAVNDPVDEKTWKELTGELKSETSYDSDLPKKLYKDVVQCEKDKEELQKISAYTMDATQLQEAKKKLDVFLTQNTDRTLRAYSNNISVFMDKYYSEKCKALRDKPQQHLASENVKAAMACKEAEQARKEAIRIYRLDGSPEYANEAKYFLAKYFFPELKYSFGGTPGAASTTAPVSDLEKERASVLEMISSARAMCDSVSTAYRSAGEEVIRKTKIYIGISRPTVETVLNSVYTPETEKAFDQMFVETREDVQGIVKQFVANPAKRTAIVDSYDALKKMWVQLPKDEDYIRGNKNEQILNWADAARDPAQMDQPLTMFTDPDLNYFTELNANYVPNIQMGQAKLQSRVSMMPGFLLSLKSKPAFFHTVLAHEIGHNIGPQISRLNGFDLRPEYKDLLACYATSKSINMKPQQSDETIADYISSEVVAKKIASLPADQRENALKLAMEPYCHFDADSEHEISANCSGSHPQTTLRVGGIFGANPNIRNAIGCKEESLEYKTCGLQQLSASNTAAEKSEYSNGTPATPGPGFGIKPSSTQQKAKGTK